jgi:hypothetical protein
VTVSSTDVGLLQASVVLATLFGALVMAYPVDARTQRMVLVLDDDS